MSDQLKLSRSKFILDEVKLCYLAVLAALFITALSPILFRISENFLSSSATIFNRFWIATVILSFWKGLLFLKRRSLENSPPLKLFDDLHSLILLLILAIVFVIFQLLWIWSVTLTSIANSEVMHSLTPVFTTLVGWSLFGQKFDRQFLMGVAIAIMGSIALAVNDFSITLDKLTGDGLALLSACLWGANLLILEQLQTRLNIVVITILECLLGALFILPALLLTGGQLFPHSQGGWLTVISLGLTVIFAQTLIAYSLKRLSSGLVATILLINPILAAIFAAIIFSETLNLLNSIGLLIILGGIYLTTLSKYGIKTQ
ncbi:MAG TPA: EamA family transporter [Cyanothece sp. UBA12306]|nr:EamA family transporter [Cyanothece sp. UBA12306]